MLVYIDDREDEELENPCGDDYDYDYEESSEESFYDYTDGKDSYFG